MSNADCFTWHPDQDDHYNGNRCGSMSLRGSPALFNKVQPFGFTMAGADEDALTLQAAATANDAVTFWPQQVSASSRVNFDITGGTFKYISTDAALHIGNSRGKTVPNVLFNVIGRCELQALEVNGYDVGTALPATEIDIRESGVLSISANICSSAFTVKIGDMGAMAVDAATLDLNASRYTVNSVAPDSGYSLDLSPSGDRSAEGRSIALENTSIICQSQSKTRLRSKRIGLDTSFIRAEDDAVVDFACDLVSIDSGSLFTLSHGSASFRFSSADGEQRMRIDTTAGKTPGIFNFITNQGDNNGVFLFRAQNQAYAREQWLQALAEKWIAIDGTPTSGTVVNGYRLNGGSYDGTYMSVFLEKA